MSQSRAIKWMGLLGGVGMFLQSNSVHACAMCMGGADNKTGPALNGAIFLLLGFLGAMFTGIGAVAYHFVKRARAVHSNTEFSDPAPGIGAETLS